MKPYPPPSFAPSRLPGLPSLPVPRADHSHFRRRLPFLVLALALAPSPAVAAAASDVLAPAAPGTVAVAGWLGDKLERSRTHRVYAQNLERILRPYRDRREENAGHWRCEYWGKWFTSAALAAAYAPPGTPRTKLDAAVRGLLATQTPDGYIGTYKPDKHLGIWDVWGRKYTLLGLLAAHDLTGDAAALAAARRVADHLIREAPPGQFNLGENGIDVLKGLAPNSILEPMVLLHARTGDARYLDFARSLVADWEKPNKFLPQGLQLIASAQQGVPPLQIASPKAYEMMSCFEGLCELYRVTGDKTYLDAAVRFAHSIRRTELMVHGSGSNHELWCDGTRTQTELLEQPVETCVTVTWMKLCHQLLRLTGDPLWADELELSLYNALLGAMTPDGGWWAYFSPLAGQRVPSHFQHADVQMSCCTANGPRGLHLTPAWAVMRRADGLAVNLYAPGRATPALADGTVVTLEQRTDYPAGDTITLEVTPARRARFALHLRIPAWSQRSSLAVNGETVAARPGAYAVIAREWVAGDRVTLQLDLRGRAVPAPSGAPHLAVRRGPIVLALDNRLAQEQDVAVRLVADAEGYVALQPAKVKPAEVWLAFDVPFEVRPTHFFKHRTITLPMCDFASAGNGWSSANLFRTWLPQPLFLRHMFPADTWRLMCPDLKECPPIPLLTDP